MRREIFNKDVIPSSHPVEKGGEGGFESLLFVLCSLFFLLSTLFCLFSTSVFADELQLQPLIDEALKNNHEVLMYESRASAAGFRVPQAESLPDPMFMFGYENEGVRDLYTFDEEMAADSQYMFSISQMFPYPGKLDLKAQMASRDAESVKALKDAARLKTIARVKELYYDLFLTYKTIDLVKERNAFFTKVEDAAMARYSTGMAPQQEVLMAQTEKYMLLEKEEMLRQKIQSLEAMLDSTVGREPGAPLGRPQEISTTEYAFDVDALNTAAQGNSPEIKAQMQMVEAADARVKMAIKEYYPDFTITANYSAKNKYFEDMWGVNATINIPLFYKTKQRQAVLEAEARQEESDHEIKAMRLMLLSNIRDNYSMLKTAERLMDLYKNALIPKTYQDFESALSGYATGKIEAITVISRLKYLFDYETLYWQQFVEREKAIARLEALTTVKSRSPLP